MFLLCLRRWSLSTVLLFVVIVSLTTTTKNLVVVYASEDNNTTNQEQQDQGDTDDAKNNNSTHPSRDNVSSKLLVHIPHKLHRDGGYDHREALFGIPKYGGSIAQNVYYTEEKLCDLDEVDTTGGYPRRDDKSPWPAPYILMVDRGDCSFVQKVRNAQRTGAAAVLIADTYCLCDDKPCVEANPNVQCEDDEPVMGDDGSGSDISIPSFLMYKNDADLIKEEVLNNRYVQLEMKWSLPSPDDRVEYELWTTPTDKLSYTFMQQFKAVAEALGEHAFFTPHQYIYDGVRAHCTTDNTDNFCFNLCTNGGRYCATDPDGEVNQGISGADVVTESLRRLCIWSHYGESDGIGLRWWDYVSAFLENCNEDPENFKNQDCVDRAYDSAGIDGGRIEQCMKDSGNVLADVDNSKLSTEVKDQVKRGVYVLPTAFINNAAIRGALTPANVFTAICAGYLEGSQPDICRTCSDCDNVVGCAQNGGVCGEYSGVVVIEADVSQDQVSHTTFAGSMVFVVAVLAVVGVWHYKRTREQMREQVRDILAQYMPLQDEDGNAHNGMTQPGFGNGSSIHFTNQSMTGSEPSYGNGSSIHFTNQSMSGSEPSYGNGSSIHFTSSHQSVDESALL